MPNPTTGVLDDGNRANENPLSHGGDWGPIPARTEGRLAGQRFYGPVGPSSGESRWATTVFNADQESFVTVTQIDLSMNDAVGVVCRQANAGGLNTQYLWRLTYPIASPGGPGLLPLTGIGGAGVTYTGQLTLFRIVNNVVGRSQSVLTDLSSGDRIWLNCVGTAITGYLDHAGAGFAAVVSWTDATIAGAGRIGLYWEGSLMPSVDFGGGNV